MSRNSAEATRPPWALSSAPVMFCWVPQWNPLVIPLGGLPCPPTIVLRRRSQGRTGDQRRYWRVKYRGYPEPEWHDARAFLHDIQDVWMAFNKCNNINVNLHELRAVFVDALPRHNEHASRAGQAGRAPTKQPTTPHLATHLQPQHHMPPTPHAPCRPPPQSAHPRPASAS